ncbi:MAG: SDR family NAD(P)-dependent oxidoreductase [Clostridia bacterium]|nr:SDR family NAD(P)-dependent oxidoreductase [Clostridia bacterium]
MNSFDARKTYLVTGAAGFIGYFLAKRILDAGAKVIGFDNLNDYYEVSLKEHRLSLLEKYELFTFVKGDIADADAVGALYARYAPDITVNLAAQAGVRYSIENPKAYIDSNIIGFFNILEACRRHGTNHLVYASSSSVYGANKKMPFSTADMVDNPVSLYAATKKSNELMAHCYSKLYNFPVTGLRFFTVYGPMGRPDMAYFSFTRKILRGETIQIFNNGNMKRDFTYIDDIVEGVMRIISNPPAENMDNVRYKVYNIGNNKPEDLMDYVQALEDALSTAYGTKLEAKKEFLPMQMGDVVATYADVSDLVADVGFNPSTTIQDGLAKFAHWYADYYKEG